MNAAGDAMLGYAYDADEVALVCMLLGDQADVGDYAKLVGVIHHFGDVALRNSDRPAKILMYVGTRGPPSNNHRKAIAGGAARLTKSHFAFVSPHAIARAINIAIHLLAPARTGTERSTHASIDDALLWFETLNPGCGPVLRKLADEARHAAQAPARLA